jgi:hypothetical protein
MAYHPLKKLNVKILVRSARQFSPSAMRVGKGSVTWRSDSAFCDPVARRIPGQPILPYETEVINAPAQQRGVAVSNDDAQSGGERFVIDKVNRAVVYFTIETFNMSMPVVAGQVAKSRLDHRPRFTRLGNAMKIRVIVATLTMLAGSVIAHAQSDWKLKVHEELPLLGHRNWIVIVDSAYPLQSGAGVETVETGADQLAVLDYVLAQVKESRHVRPLVHTDTELAFVPEAEAPGVDQYRAQLKSRLDGIPVDSILHQKLIDQLNELGKSFHVLVLKSNLTIPYTSVFLQLDCKYWGADSEQRMRDAMKTAALTHSKTAKP